MTVVMICTFCALDTPHCCDWKNRFQVWFFHRNYLAKLRKIDMILPPNADAPASADGGDLAFQPSSSAMTALIREKDWSATPLGPISTWPQSLRTTVSLCLASNFPINIIWGPEAVQIYNDGYRIVCGDKHPAAMGMDYRVWSI
jgi:hypothetical protein